MNVLPESEKFGPSPWMLISRDVIEGVRTSVRAQLVLGRGVLLQTGRQIPAEVDGADIQTWGPPIYDDPVLVGDSLVVELTTVNESQVVGADNKPADAQVEILGREIVSLSVAKDRFEPKKGPSQVPSGMKLRAGTLIPLRQQRQVVRAAPAMEPGA